MNKLNLFLLSALAFFACAGLQAQVTIGGETDPVRGAILDLNSTTKGGLLLSNVTLMNLRTIPTEISEAAAINGDAAKKAQFTGAMVYHIGGNDIAAGIYVWAGKRWTPIGGAPTVKDAEGHEYSIAEFGDAGWWMTQNLRSTGPTHTSGTTTADLTKYVSGEVLTNGMFYTYPGAGTATARETALTNAPKLLKAYGLLYSWAAASGRTSVNAYEANNASQTKYQGICPDGWHLPSDWEWSELEKEIALHPWLYSDQNDAYTFANPGTYDGLYTVMGDPRPNSGTNSTYWGRQMKSMTRVPDNGELSPNSSSFPREDGGFDALPVGYVYNVNSGVYGYGTALLYGTNAIFWSSSSYGSSEVMYRFLSNSYTGVLRDAAGKTHLFSVRCKKDS